MLCLYAGRPCGASRISLRGVSRVQRDGCALYTRHNVGGQALALLLGEGPPAVSGALRNLQLYAIVGFGTVLMVRSNLRFTCHNITSLIQNTTAAGFSSIRQIAQITGLYFYTNISPRGYIFLDNIITPGV